MASEVLSNSERGALDSVLRPHLRLEPAPEADTQENKGEIAKGS